MCTSFIRDYFIELTNFFWPRGNHRYLLETRVHRSVELFPYSLSRLAELHCFLINFALVPIHLFALQLNLAPKIIFQLVHLCKLRLQLLNHHTHFISLSLFSLHLCFQAFIGQQKFLDQFSFFSDFRHMIIYN